MKVERIVSQTFKTIKRESPLILGAIGAVGVVLTSVMVAKETLKAEIRIADREDEKGEPLTAIEKATAVLPVYAPAIAIGAGTITCIVASTVLNNRQKMALSSAYILLDQSYKNYKDKIIEMFGEEASRDVEREVSKSKIDRLEKVEKPSSDEVLIFYEKHRNELFERTLVEVKDAEYQLNKKFVTTGRASLNDFYEFLGLDKTEEGEVLGWDVGLAESPEECWVDFEHDLIKTNDGMECYEILTVNEPTMDYDLPF